MDSTETTEAGSSFQTGMVRGKTGYFRTSEYVRYLVYCNSWDALFCLSKSGGEICIPLNSNSAWLDLMEDGLGGLFPPVLQSWPLKLIEHVTYVTSVPPTPAVPVGCFPLHLLQLINLWLDVEIPNWRSILQLRTDKGFIGHIPSFSWC